MSLDELIQLKKSNNIKFHFVTFGNGPYENSAKTLGKEAEYIGLFDTITVHTQLNPSWDLNHDEFKNQQGYGYWRWKPFAILELLYKIPEDDIVVYADAGCGFYKNSKLWMDWFSDLIEYEYDVLCFYLEFPENQWTKGDVYQYFEQDVNSDIGNSRMRMAGVSAFVNNERSRYFMQQWMDSMMDYEHLVNNNPSRTPNSKIFKEHRHDQSVFSAMSKILEIQEILVVKELEWDGKQEKNFHFPIRVLRRKK